MKWESKAVYQMLSCLCLFKNPGSSWMAFLAIFMLFASKYLLSGFEFFSILYTSLLLAALSIFLFTVSNKIAVPSEKEKSLSSEVEIPDQNEKFVRELAEEAQEVKDVFNYSSASTSPDVLSQSELGQEDRLSTHSEDSEMAWAFRNDVKDQSYECSDGTISDEDSLIEIALPSGHLAGQKKEEPKFNCSSLSADSLLSHQTLMEFLAEFNEMNEEENMIEIDLSIGSIKYSPRFEIQA